MLNLGAGFFGKRLNGKLFAFLLSGLLVSVATPLSVSILPAAYASSRPLEIRSVRLEGAELQIKSNRPMASARQFSMVKLSNPNRIVIELPDTIVNTGRSFYKLDHPVLKEVELAESRGEGAPSTRLTIYVSDPSVFETLNVSVQDKTLSILGGVPARSPESEAATPPTPPGPSAPAQDATKAYAAQGLNVVEDVYFRDGMLTLRATNGHRIIPKSRFVLSDPGRLVVDIEKAAVADKNLLKPITVNQENIRQIRVGQFDEETVRIVIEARSPETIQMAYEGPDKSMLSISSELGLSIQNLPSDTPLGTVEQVSVRKENEDTVIRVDASVPIVHRVVKEDGRIFVELHNLASRPGWVTYDRQQFNQLEFVKLENLTPGQPNSKLVIDMKASDLEMASRLLPDGKSFEVTLYSMPLGGRSAWGRRGGSEVARVPFPARVVIDAGHGGKDLGANREGLNEKDLNLSVAMKLKQALEARGVRVYMTRSSDEFLPLPRITQITNSIRPDLFVSVHTNSSTNPSITGLETYYYTPQSVALAKRVHHRMVNNIGSPDRGVRKAMFYVIHHTAVPAILCEMGYISNSGERRELFTEYRKQRTAEAIADGVVDYLRATMSARAK
jgi:N-acetylmuramoyl-L-alanine amidase